jgi:hypothetical protein
MDSERPAAPRRRANYFSIRCSPSYLKGRFWFYQEQRWVIGFHYPANKKGVYPAKRDEPLSISGAETQNRTGDTRIFSPLLYRLSYLGIRTGRYRGRIFPVSKEKLYSRELQSQGFFWAFFGWRPGRFANCGYIFVVKSQNTRSPLTIEASGKGKGFSLARFARGAEYTKREIITIWVF